MAKPRPFQGRDYGFKSHTQYQNISECRLNSELPRLERGRSWSVTSHSDQNISPCRERGIPPDLGSGHFAVSSTAAETKTYLQIEPLFINNNI